MWRGVTLETGSFIPGTGSGEGGVTQETVDVPQGRFWEGFNTKTIDMLPQV